MFLPKLTGYLIGNNKLPITFFSSPALSGISEVPISRLINIPQPHFLRMFSAK